ncbi:hypothetical protein HDU80_009389 [Chytriomyces hyalinus]|nr:hypothetical protein HDU80_009389 [Chytriomyces hyalinus]
MGNSNSVASSDQPHRRQHRMSLGRRLSELAATTASASKTKNDAGVPPPASTRISIQPEEVRVPLSEQLCAEGARTETTISISMDELIVPSLPRESVKSEDSVSMKSKKSVSDVGRSYTVSTMSEYRPFKQEFPQTTSVDDGSGTQSSALLKSKDMGRMKEFLKKGNNNSNDSFLSVDAMQRAKSTSSKRAQFMSSHSIPLSPMITQAVQDLERIRNQTPILGSTPKSLFSGTSASGPMTRSKPAQKSKFETVVTAPETIDSLDSLDKARVLDDSVDEVSTVLSNHTVNQDFILPIPTLGRQTAADQESSNSSFGAPPLQGLQNFSEGLTALAAKSKIKKIRSQKAKERIRKLACAAAEEEKAPNPGSLHRPAGRSLFSNDLEQQQFSMSRQTTALHKFNSCSTLFIDSTLSNADLQKTLKCVATALAVNIRRNHELNILKTVDIFSEKRHPLSKHIQFYLRILSEEDIFKFLDCIFQAAELNVECAVITLVYIERMLLNTGITLHSCNWARIVLGGLLLASKVWDDHAVWNVDFCQIFPDIVVADLNELERWYMSAIQYNVSVKASIYARYYFELRDLLDTETRVWTSKPATEMTQNVVLPSIQVEAGSNSALNTKDDGVGGGGGGGGSSVTADLGVGCAANGFEKFRRSRSDYAFVPVKPPAHVI